VTAEAQEEERGKRKAHLDRLTSELIERSSCSYLPLVTDHVTKTLIVDDTDVNVGVKLFSGNSRVHRFVSVVVVSSGFELFSKVLERCVVLGEVERCTILCESVHCSCFRCDRFDEHTDRHSRRESVRVDDDVGLHAGFTERHVDGRVLLRTDTLLSVTR